MEGVFCIVLFTLNDPLEAIGLLEFMCCELTNVTLLSNGLETVLLLVFVALLCTLVRVVVEVVIVIG